MHFCAKCSEIKIANQVKKIVFRFRILHEFLPCHKREISIFNEFLLHEKQINSPRQV